MSLYLVRAEGTPLQQRRGVETIDRNILFVLVQASVEPVAQAFSELKQMNVWIRDAYECEMEIQNESTFVFQLQGHPWSIIYKPYMRGMKIELTQEDACSISELLNTSAIYYIGSDTCGTIGYHFYQNGVSLERLFFEEEDSLEFQSQVRQLQVEDIQDTYTFTMNFIQEQDAYIPCLMEMEDLVAGQHQIISIENLMSNEMARLDYLAQQI